MTAIDSENPVSKLVENALQEFFGTDQSIINCEKVTSTQHVGFTSEVSQYLLEWSKKDDQATEENSLPKSVVVKMPVLENFNSLLDNVSQGNRAKVSEPSGPSPQQMVMMIHKTECEAYKILLSAQPTCPVPIAKVYATSVVDPAVIVMEDLSGRAAIKSIAEGLNLNQWRNVVTYTATLHAWSLTIGSEELKKRLPETATLSYLYKSYTEVVKGNLKKTIEKYPTYFGHVDEALYEKEIRFENMMQCYQQYRRFLPDVMVQGDLWSNNIMFRKDDTNGHGVTDEVVAFVDWQVSLLGCGVLDLVRLNSWCIPHELRRRHTDEILKLYVDQFHAALPNSHGSNIGRPLTQDEIGQIKSQLTLDNVKKVYDHAMAIRCLLCVPVTDFVMNFVTKKSEKEQDNLEAKQEILARMKAAYDDAEAYFKSDRVVRF